MKYCVNCNEPLPSGLPDCTSTAKPEDKSLARLIAAIGKTGAAERTWFEGWFRALKRDVLNRLPAFEAEGEHRELLRKFQDNTAERRRLREQLAPFRHELARIRYFKLEGCPEETRDVMRLLTDPDIVARIERSEEKDIGIFLKLFGRLSQRADPQAGARAVPGDVAKRRHRAFARATADRHGGRAVQLSRHRPETPPAPDQVRHPDHRQRGQARLRKTPCTASQGLSVVQLLKKRKLYNAERCAAPRKSGATCSVLATRFLRE